MTAPTAAADPQHDADGTGPERLTVGVEEEYHLVDPATGSLTSAAGEVLAQLDDDAFEDELQRSMVETRTEPHRDLRALRRDLTEHRSRAIAAAETVGVRLVSSGTVPLSDWREQDITSTERYEGIAAAGGEVAQEQVVCGCHVHVGVPGPEEAVRVLAHVRPWLPALLALSASSPYWQGRDTAFRSFRTVVWDMWPSAGLPPDLTSKAEYDAVVEALLRTGTLADAGQLYWSLRPSRSFPTVEFRIADASPTLEDTLLHAALCRGLVATALRELADGRPPVRAPRAVVESAVWRAARSGIAGDLVDPVTAAAVPARQHLEALVAHVAPALTDHGDLDAVVTSVERVVATGTSADRQRRVVARTGRLEDAVAALGEETRDLAGRAS